MKEKYSIGNRGSVVGEAFMITMLLGYLFKRFEIGKYFSSFTGQNWLCVLLITLLALWVFISDEYKRSFKREPIEAEDKNKIMDRNKRFKRIITREGRILLVCLLAFIGSLFIKWFEWNKILPPVILLSYILRLVVKLIFRIIMTGGKK